MLPLPVSVDWMLMLRGAVSSLAQTTVLEMTFISPVIIAGHDELLEINGRRIAAFDADAARRGEAGVERAVALNDKLIAGERSRGGRIGIAKVWRANTTVR